MSLLVFSFLLMCILPASLSSRCELFWLFDFRFFLLLVLLADANAHPHTDQNKRIALAHNGTIQNADSLRQMLSLRGVQFRQGFLLSLLLLLSIILISLMSVA